MRWDCERAAVMILSVFAPKAAPNGPDHDPDIRSFCLLSKGAPGLTRTGCTRILVPLSQAVLVGEVWQNLW